MGKLKAPGSAEGYDSIPMERYGEGELFFGALTPHDSLMVCQTRKGCCQTCCGCDANEDFQVRTRVGKEKAGDEIFHIREETGCCVRFFCGSNRPWAMQMNQGTSMSGTDPLLQFERPCRCPMACGKCCCYQEVEIFSADSNGNAKTPLGHVTESCWFCVPSFNMYDETGRKEATINQPTCCGGMCVNCCAQGCCNCRIPFYIFMEPDHVHNGEITKVWGGLFNELIDVDKFECKFPAVATPAAKARYIGATLMINQLFFERQKEEEAELAAN